jgi:RimJ/RimL family protein N-acetyltransferase
VLEANQKGKAMIQIRPAQESDAHSVMALKQSVLQQSRFLLLEPDEYQPTLESETKFIEHYENSENSILLLALDDDNAIGHIVAQGMNFQRNRHSASVYMAVHQDYWGQGIGRRLMQRLLEWFQQSPLLRLELTTATDNERAFSLYKSIGFEQEGIKRQDIIIDGTPVDSYLMSYLKKNTNTEETK